MPIEEEERLRTGGVSRAGRKRKNTERGLEEYTIEIGNMKSELKELKKKEKGLKKKVTEFTKKYDDWKNEFPYRIHDNLTNWGRQLMVPAKEYYTHLFSDSEGDCSNVVHMAEAAELFNPIMPLKFQKQKLSQSYTIWQIN